MRTQLFMTVQGAALHLMKEGYRQDDITGEWYARGVHAEIQRRPKGAAIVFHKVNQPSETTT